jgi:hypothetical protein
LAKAGAIKQERVGKLSKAFTYDDAALVEVSVSRVVLPVKRQKLNALPKKVQLARGTVAKVRNRVRLQEVVVLRERDNENRCIWKVVRLVKALGKNKCSKIT